MQMDGLEVLECIELNTRDVKVVFEGDMNEKIEGIVDPDGEWTPLTPFGMRLNRIQLTDLKHAVEYFITKVCATPEGKNALAAKRSEAITGAKRPPPPKYKALFLSTDIGKVVNISGDTVTVGEGDARQERPAFWGSTELPLTQARVDIVGLKITSVVGTFNGNVKFENDVVISNPGNASIGPIVAPTAGAAGAKTPRATRPKLTALETQVKEQQEQMDNDGLEIVELEAQVADLKDQLGAAGDTGSQSLGLISLRSDLLALSATILRGLHDALKIRHPEMPGYSSKSQSVDAILSPHFQ